jgi:hypothetical protein
VDGVLCRVFVACAVLSTLVCVGGAHGVQCVHTPGMESSRGWQQLMDDSVMNHDMKRVPKVILADILLSVLRGGFFSVSFLATRGKIFFGN